VYGADPGLRASLERRGMSYVLAAAKDHRATAGAGPLRADVLAARLPPRAWQRLSAGSGAKGHRWHDWAWVAIEPGRPGCRWLLIRRHRRTHELAYYRCYSPAIIGWAPWCGLPGAGGPVRGTSRPARAWPASTNTRSASGPSGTGGSPSSCSPWPSSPRPASPNVANGPANADGPAVPQRDRPPDRARTSTVPAPATTSIKPPTTHEHHSLPPGDQVARAPHRASPRTARPGSAQPLEGQAIRAGAALQSGRRRSPPDEGPWAWPAPMLTPLPRRRSAAGADLRGRCGVHTPRSCGS
jgi:hypothetical protein